MTDPRHLKARIAEARVGLWEGIGGCIVVPLVSFLFVPELVALMPVVGVMAAINFRRYRRAKRDLAAFNKPPTARLLR